MTYSTIKYALDDDGIVTITLNRPDRLNAFNQEMLNDLLAAYDQIDNDDDVRAVIVTGEGRGFCAGADLAARGDTFNAEARGRDSSKVHRDGGGLVSLRAFALTKPIIAAINGPAVGVGVTMTLPMDFRLAAESARIGFVFTRRGLVPEAVSSWFLPRLVGITQAARWCYSGRVFDAAEAASGGLVETVPDAELLGRARELALEVSADSAPVSVALTRQMLWQGLTFSHPMYSHMADSRGIQFLGQMADAVEGVESFLDKRPPEWSLRPSIDTPDIFPFVEDPEFS